MGEKDITEKILEDHNDVFADIINGLIFAGEQRILPESLENTAVHSQYKADDEKVHELERDVAKYWKDQDVQLAICGIENQSSVEKYMPFRIIGYFRDRKREKELTMGKGKKQYFNEINIMRGMAVLCVVIGHSFNPTETPTILGFVKSFVYCFHMPAFFFISGFLEGEKRRSFSEKKQAIVKKVKRLMVPYFFLTVVTAVLKILFGAFARNPLQYSTLVVDVLIGRNNPNGGLWFLYALFIISIFGILFDTVNRAILTGVMLVLYVLNAAVFKQSGYIIGFFFSYAWIYFMGGVARRYFYANLKKLQLVMSAKGTAITVVASAGYMVLAFVRIYSVQSLILTTAVTIIGVFWLFIIAMQIEHYHYGEKLWMLLGDYGMDIYMIGYYVQQAIFVVCGKILGLDYLIYAWLMLILGLIAPILLSKYIVRKSKMLSILILGR